MNYEINKDSTVKLDELYNNLKSTKEHLAIQFRITSNMDLLVYYHIFNSLRKKKKNFYFLLDSKYKFFLFLPNTILIDEFKGSIINVKDLYSSLPFWSKSTSENKYEYTINNIFEKKFNISPINLNIDMDNYFSDFVMYNIDNTFKMSENQSILTELSACGLSAIGIQLDITNINAKRPKPFNTIVQDGNIKIYNTIEDIKNIIKTTKYFIGTNNEYSLLIYMLIKQENCILFDTKDGWFSRIFNFFDNTILINDNTYEPKSITKKLEYLYTKGYV
jgi:hypothetical protein